MLIDQYNRIIISKLPSNIATELAEIKDNTDNFSDEDLMEIYKDNFTSLFKLIEKDYPEAMKAKPTLVKNKSGKPQLVKKSVEKKKLVKKKEAKPKLIKKAVHKIPVKEIVIHWAEGDTSKYDKFPKTYKSWEAAHNAVIPVFEDTKGGEGYNKLKFTVYFEDGEEYEGRLDVSEKEDNTDKTHNVIGKHIKDYLDYLLTEASGTSKKEMDETKEWLEKYDLGLNDKSSFDSKYNGKMKPKYKVGNNVLVKMGPHAGKGGLVTKIHNDKLVPHYEIDGIDKPVSESYIEIKAYKKQDEDNDYDLSKLIGKKVELYAEGVKEPTIHKIIEAFVTDKKYDKRDVVISVEKNTEERFPLSKLESFLEGKQIDFPESSMILVDAADEDCATAIAEVRAIKARKEESAKKRANAPKKKVSTAAGEKQVKTVTSIFKTSGFKGHKDKAEKFAEDLVKVYRKHGLDAIADKLQTEMQGVIETQYKEVKKLKQGGKLNSVKDGDVVYNSTHNTIGIVREVFNDGGGDLRTDADGVVPISELEKYDPSNSTHKKAHIAPSTKQELEKRDFKL